MNDAAVLEREFTQFGNTGQVIGLEVQLESRQEIERKTGRQSGGRQPPGAARSTPRGRSTISPGQETVATPATRPSAARPSRRRDRPARCASLDANHASSSARMTASPGAAWTRTSQSTASPRKESLSSTSEVTRLEISLALSGRLHPTDGERYRLLRASSGNFHGISRRHQTARRVEDRVFHELVSARDGNAQTIGHLLEGVAFEPIHR